MAAHMKNGLRPFCWEIPSARIVMLFWVRSQDPTGWAKLWAAIARAWRA